MQKYLILIAGVLIIAAVMFGCDDRGTGISPVDMGNLETWGVSPVYGHVFQPALTLQMRNSTEQLLHSMYIPPEALEGKPVPLLVLLAPETGNRFYYFQSGLLELIRELTASGQIQPMVVYCMANDQTFGGYFYGNSDPAGRYDSIFNSDGLLWSEGGRDDLLEFIHTFVPATIDLSSKRGIGGVGQGAYGAFRAVIKNPGMFSSISVADGPLDFDGGANGGLRGLFSDALAEQKEYYYRVDPLIDTLKDTTFVPGTNYDAVWIDTSMVGGNAVIDTTWVDFDTLPFDYYRDFDTSQTMPLSMMFMGGAFAFSPNDTLITYTRSTIANRYVMISNVTQFQIANGSLPGGGDSTTLISSLIKPDSYSHNLDMDFHLPFDSTGAVYTPIWERWIGNNLENMYWAQGGRPLDGTKMFFATNRNARWNYDQMTQSWITFLREVGYGDSITVYPYDSYDDRPVVNDEYLFDLLRQMLIFHSDHFGK